MQARWKLGSVGILAMAIGFGASPVRAEGEVTDQDRRDCLDEKNPPVRGSNFEKDAVRLCRLHAEVTRLRQEYRASADESVEARIDAELDAILPEYRRLRRQVNRAGRKIAKADRKQERIERLERDIDELEKSKEGKTPEEVAEIDATIVSLEGRIRTREKAIARKERKYAKITGDVPPSRVPSPKPSPSPVPAVKRLSHDEKMKLAECWTKGDAPLTERVTAYFPVGQTEIKTGSMYGFEHQVFDLFVAEARAVARKFHDRGYRIYRVEASSRESKVGASGRAPASLNAKRGTNAARSFFAAAKAGDPAYLLEALDLEPAVDVTPSGQAPIGPDAPRLGYRALAERKLTDAQKEAEIRKAAAAILKSSDPTPVRGKDLEETVVNLRKCCDADLGAILYQPYQYATLTFYGAKFTPDSDACVAKSDKVANGAGVKRVKDVCVPTPNRNCDAYVPDAAADGTWTDSAN